MGQVDLRNAVPIEAAASDLGVSRSEVRRLIHDGDLHARQVADRWLVPVVELHRLGRLARPVGRPYDPASAWALLQMLDGHADELPPVRRSQLRRVLREADPHDLAARLRRRADRQLWYVHPSLVDDVLAGEHVHPSGWSRLPALDIDLVAGDDVPAEAYVAADHLDDLVEEYALAPAESVANLILHVVVDDDPIADALPSGAVVLDLLESGDPRARDAAARLWRARLLQFRGDDDH